MAAPPLKSAIYPDPTVTEAKYGFGQLYDYLTGLLGTTGNVNEALIAISGGVFSGGTTAVSISGNFNFLGNGRRITGEFTSTTPTERLFFQTSATNNYTAVGILPHGTSTSSWMYAVNNSNPTDAAFASLGVSASAANLESGITGTGTYLPLTLTTGGAVRLTINENGIAGIKVTPAAWGNSYSVMDIGAGSAIANMASNTHTEVVSNAYYNGTNWKYKNTTLASKYTQINGEHAWYNAPTGTAGNNIGFVLAMGLDTNGNLFIGGSSAATTALVDLTSTTKGLRLPRMSTSQKEAIADTEALLVYDSTTKKLSVNDGTGWGDVAGSGGAGATGAGSDQVFVQNDTFITGSWCLGQDKQVPCTISIASPCVVTQTNTYVAGARIYFRTDGALPTGILPEKGYYVSAAGLSGSSYQISETSGGASINTTGTQSGSHTAGKLVSASISGNIEVASGVTITVPSGAELIIK